MENFIENIYANLEEIQLPIYDSETAYYGGSQDWFPKKMHQLSGCGPVAAANITAYLSQTFPDKYKALYPFHGALSKKDFIEHMIEVRKFVRPGLRGLTCVNQFVDNTIEFANHKGISLTPHILDGDSTSMEDAIEYISTALEQRLPISILILTHPVKELEDYVWHWMTITHLKYDQSNNSYYITASTYGERREIDLDLLWNHRCPTENCIKLAYFT